MTEGVKKELRPLLFSLLFLGLGVFVLWVANYLLQHDPATSMGDVVLVSLLVMPILIYAIISGSLTELKGPGGGEQPSTRLLPRLSATPQPTTGYLSRKTR
jgi:hypothetical protein